VAVTDVPAALFKTQEPPAKVAFLQVESEVLVQVLATAEQEVKVQSVF